MSAIGRLQSNSKIENLFGLLYYIFLLSIPVLGLSFFIALKFNYLGDHVKLFSSMLALTYLFIFTNLLTLKDYGKASNAHMGTIDYFLAKLNITSSRGIGNGFSPSTRQKGEGWIVILILAAIISLSGLVSGLLIAAVDKNTSPLILFGYNAFLVLFSLFINSDIINKQKVSSELLEVMFEMKNISETGKRYFYSNVKNCITNRGFVTRMEVFKACSEILDEQVRIAKIKKKENAKEEYTNFLKKVN